MDVSISGMDVHSAVIFLTAIPGQSRYLETGLVVNALAAVFGSAKTLFQSQLWDRSIRLVMFIKPFKEKNHVS